MSNWIDTLNARARGEVEGFVGAAGDQTAADKPRTYSELSKLCGQHDLPRTGKKADLEARLRAAGVID